jgi:glycosyltransferase involved in cell wall biosynthesis
MANAPMALLNGRCCLLQILGFILAKINPTNPIVLHVEPHFEVKARGVQPLKIAFDHEAFGIQLYGGVSRYFCRLARELSRLPTADVSVRALFTCNQHLRDIPDLCSATALLPPFHGYRHILPFVNTRLAGTLYALGPPDILHHTSPAPTFIVSRGTARIITVHDMVHELFPAYYKANPFSAKKIAAIKMSDGIIAISESTKRDILKVVDIDPARIRVVHHGVDQPPDVPPAKFDNPYILHVGRRDLYKNFDLVLEAFVQSPALRDIYYIVAFGGGAFTDDEQSRIKHLGLQKKVIHRSGDDMILWSHYRGAAAFVFPSKYEGFGLPLLEAMSLGCPVICSDTSCFPEVAGDAAQYFDPTSVDSLISSLMRILRSPEEREEHIIRGYARARKFSWKHCAEQTLDFYASLSSGRSYSNL